MTTRAGAGLTRGEIDPRNRGTISEHWNDAFDAPWPSEAEIFAARQSPVKRREVDLAYARAHGLPPDQVEPFLERLALSDLRRAAWERREAIEGAAGAEDTRAGMLVRVDALIAELGDQLAPLRLVA